MTTQRAKQVVRETLLSLGIDQFFKLSGKTVSFQDLARAECIFVTANRINKGWYITEKAMDVLKSKAKENGFIVTVT
jgi:hypothetical protein